MQGVIVAIMFANFGLRRLVSSTGRTSHGRSFSSRAVICKFGGTSVATVASITEILGLLNLDKDRRYVIVSAPGKRFDDDVKVTDLLYESHALAAGPGVQGYASFFDENIGDRFRQLAGELAPTSDGKDLDAALEAAKAKIFDLASAVRFAPVVVPLNMLHPRGARDTAPVMLYLKGPCCASLGRTC